MQNRGKSKLEPLRQNFHIQKDILDLVKWYKDDPYTNKACFIDELIANSKDDNDLHRFKDQGSAVPEGRLPVINGNWISIIPDESEKSITILDTGVGKSRFDLINNWGVVTKDKCDMLRNNYRCGIWSSFLVADGIIVQSKNEMAIETIMEADFTTQTLHLRWLLPAERGLGRGTSVKLYLKKEFTHLLEKAFIRKQVEKSWPAYPIILQKKNASQEGFTQMLLNGVYHG